MGEPIEKKNWTEEDIKRLYITPAISAKWDELHIRMEERITVGKVNIEGNRPYREKAKKADYVLYLAPNYAIAVVEAKDNNHTVSSGLQQAMEYAQMLKAKFAYSSNGDAFFEHDFLTGKEREIPLDQFPSLEELRERYEKSINNGQGLNDDEKKFIYQNPFYTDQNTHSPRYYQRNAVNRTLDAIARGQDRLLLVMATGTGKTYTAFQIVYRLLKSGLKKKVLYLADRNILVDQSIQQDFRPLEKCIHKINFAKDDPVTITAHEVYFSLYQQLTDRDGDAEEPQEDETASRLSQLFQPDFFDLIIVDECHRGSAREASNWRRILEYFPTATQIGMTATPKETNDISNIAYFGEPVYTYSLREGVDDGFLAPFKVINIRTNIGEGWRPYQGQTDANGQLIEDRIYTNKDFDYNIVIEDRDREVAQEITDYLKHYGRMQKTIVFCANEDHAERMRIALNNLNADMVQKNPDYVVRITGSDEYGKGKLSYFISASEKYPVIATTSKLLSTGADCKTTKLIVLDQMINSMTEFKQIIGRGTRIREDAGKMFFVVMDFRNVSRLFADPDWDGPIEQDEDYGKKKNAPAVSPAETEPSSEEGPASPKEKVIVGKDGCTVRIIDKTVSIYDTQGRLLKTVDIIDYTRTNILGTYASLEGFIRKWSAEEKKENIRDLLREHGIDLEVLKADQQMSDVDDFDFIRHLAFDVKPLTRKERAENVKKRDFLSKYSGPAREVLEALLDKYMNVGVYEISRMGILKVDPFTRFGAPARIVDLFGGKAGYLRAVQELEQAIYNVI
jgi:type I restriction enzyme R subunit